mgnify:CR=1 FL=1
MKKIIPILISLIMIVGCCKQDIISECELNNTFQLHYKNYYHYTPITLCVIQSDVQKCEYTVQPDEVIVVDVQTNYKGIYLIQNQDTLDTFTLRPNPCANLNYVN